MQALTLEHEHIRILASRELYKFGIKLKIKKLPSKKASPKTRCYAVPLHQLETVEVNIGNDPVPIPKVFNDLVTFIRKDLTEEGIFRREGSKVREKKLVKSLDEGYAIPEDTCIIEVCAVTKAFLRNIPGHLIPNDVVPWFLEASKLERHSDVAVGLCIWLLPLKNIYLLIFLMQFFNDVTAKSSANKMTAYNLAVVIAPNIFPPTTSTSLQAQGEMSSKTLIITQMMIEKAKSYGAVPVELLNKLQALHEEEQTTNKKNKEVTLNSKTNKQTEY